MKKFIAIVALSTALPFAGGAMAQEFPAWSIAQACKGDVTCPGFELLARGQVSGVWKTLPPELAAKCTTDVAAVDKSYRLLQDCLANAMQELLKNQHRKPPVGDVVQMTPKAKIKAPPPPAPPAPASEPAPQAAPSTPAPPQ